MSILNRTRRKPPPTQVEANLTSMIDVVFLLIVFFILVSQVVNREAEPLDLPEVPDAATTTMSVESMAAACANGASASATAVG